MFNHFLQQAKEKAEQKLGFWVESSSSHRHEEVAHSPRPHASPSLHSYRPRPFLHTVHTPRSRTKYHRDLRPLTNQLSSSHDQHTDLDLDLNSEWFVNGKFPPKTIPTRTYVTSSGWSSSGSRKTHHLIVHMRFKNLSSSKIRLTWDSSNPGYTVKAEQRHFPPPRMLSQRELKNYRDKCVNSPCLNTLWPLTKNQVL